MENMKQIKISGKIFGEEDPDWAMDKAASDLHDCIVSYIGACKRAPYSFTDEEIDDMIANIACKAIQDNLKMSSWGSSGLLDMDGNKL